jgi:hypothetical protein
LGDYFGLSLDLSSDVVRIGDSMREHGIGGVYTNRPDQVGVCFGEKSLSSWVMIHYRGSSLGILLPSMAVESASGKIISGSIYLFSMNPP